MVYVKNKNYITFDGISFTGANKVALQKDSCNYIVIQNCSFNNNGRFAIAGTVLHHISVLNDSIQNSLSNAIRYDPNDSSKISGNYIRNTGMFAGMGDNGEGMYVGIYAFGRYDAGYGRRDTISNNKVINSGYIGIRFTGINSFVYRNFVDSFGMVKDDGAGIYTFVGNGNPNYDTGTIVRSNIISNGIGAPLQVGGTDKYSSGLYMDDGTVGVTLDSNTIFNTTFADIFLHNTGLITVTANTITDSTARSVEMQAVNAVIKGNIFHSKNASYNNNLFTILNNGANLSGLTSDSNYFLRPILETDIINAFHLPYSANYSLAQWQTLSSKDLHSYGMPSGVTSIYSIFHYNPTLSDSTISLSGTYIDARGTTHINSIILHPFQSAILFPTTATIIRRFPKFKFYKLN